MSLSVKKNGVPPIGLIQFPIVGLREDQQEPWEPLIFGTKKPWFPVDFPLTPVIVWVEPLQPEVRGLLPRGLLLPAWKGTYIAQQGGVPSPGR